MAGNNVFFTHEVSNQPPALENYNLFQTDIPLQQAFKRYAPTGSEKHVHTYGELMGKTETIEQGRLANEFPPAFKPFDRFGERINEVEFHPAYHHMMTLGVESGMAALPWSGEEHSSHVCHAALEYLHTQAEPGTCCPLTMTYASVAALRHQKDIADTWLPKILSRQYDPRNLPMSQKSGVTIGMAMTELQGGSDVRANETTATQGGSANEYRLLGHKWFCSAPMCDAFLTLAYTDAGLTCFLSPRWTPDGRRNALHIQRLKDKLGNRSNASSEIEYHNAFAERIGEEGKGIKTILDMVHHTRLDCSVAPIALMRQALVQAIHFSRHRSVFQKKLVDQPLMQSVLADLALDVEAGTALFMHMAHKFDQSDTDADAKVFSRLGVALAKYWHNKLCPNFIYEAMECLGGAGYVEESILPRLYREAPLNSIWEGSGNVICLDILRTLHKEPRAMELYFTELAPALGSNAHLDQAIKNLKECFSKSRDLEQAARLTVERMALCLQAALLVIHAPTEVSALFCSTRLGTDGGKCYGILPSGAPLRMIIDRAYAGNHSSL